MAADGELQVELQQEEGFRFEVRFGDEAWSPLHTDEPPPLGQGTGPNPSRLLAAAVANCLAASLLFAMRKFKNDPAPLHATATLKLARNADNRLRVGRVAVELQLGVPAAQLQQLDRILGQFEDFCVVTQSVRQAFPVDVRVLDSLGTVLMPPS